MKLTDEEWYPAFHEAQMACKSGRALVCLSVLTDLRTKCIEWAQEPTSERAAALEQAITATGWKWQAGPIAPKEA
jgi:hypothetical protein